MKPSKLDADEQEVLDHIRDHGCQIMHVHDDQGDEIDFSYSVGFPVSVCQPEVIVFGLRFEVMQYMINELRRQCAEGLKLKDGLCVGGLIEGFDCVVRHVVSEEAIKQHFGWAIWYHRTQRRQEMCEAYQVVWPSKLQGLFPWEEGCASEVIDCQPALFEMEEAA
jgi:hypothetical protein